MSKKETLKTPGFTTPVGADCAARNACKLAAKLMTKRNRLLKKAAKIETRLTSRTGLAVGQLSGLSGLTGRVKRRQVAKALGYPA